MVGVVWAAALLLGFAGVSKLGRPAPTARAVLAARLPGGAVLASTWVVRLIGLTESLIAACVLVIGGSISAALLAFSNLMLTAVAWRMLITTAPGTDCGCFGAAAEPISRWHVVVNVFCLAGAAIAVFYPQLGVPAEFDNVGLSTLLALALALLLAWLGTALMTSFPALLAQRAKVAASR